MNFRLILGKGFNTSNNKIVIGTARSESRQNLDSLKRVNIKSRQETDFYPDAGLALGFDGAETLVFIQVSAPSVVYIGEQQLIGTEFHLAGDAMAREIGAKPFFDDGGLYWLLHQVCMQISDSQIQTVAVFKKGYYSDFYEE